MGRKPAVLAASLTDSLHRMDLALARGRGEGLVLPTTSASARLDLPTWASALGAGALGVVAAATGVLWVLLPAAGLGVFAGLLAGQRLGRRRLTRGGSRAHIGMGADVATDAVVEPGAVVEMGASVKAGAVVKRGATIRMGATVQAGAVIEPGATVSWGATVGASAVVGQDAFIGAGSDVQPGARVAPGTSAWPGSTLHAAAGRLAVGDAAAGVDPSSLEADSPAHQLQTVCASLERALAEAPEPARAFLGAPSQVIVALRASGEDLLSRARALRRESDPAVLDRLEAERGRLAERLEHATDEAVRRSLAGAVAAIDQQRRERGLLARSADRLEAEETRLVFTLEHMATQFLRVRAAGAQVHQPLDGALEASVEGLQAELEAIAEALEAVSQPPGPQLEPPVQPLAAVASGEMGGVERPALEGERER